jgi:hypothetical protein
MLGGVLQCETQAHDLGSRQKEDRGGTAGEVGEFPGEAEVGYVEPAEPAVLCGGRAFVS